MMLLMMKNSLFIADVISIITGEKRRLAYEEFCKDFYEE